MPTKTQKVHLIERPEKTDHQVNGDPVRPNLLFAQQISNLCCFTARDQWLEATKLQIFLIKKGYIEQGAMLL